jgi:hypothetical protein
MSLYATARLESLSAQQGLNKFALKSKLYINAIRQVFDELQQLKSATAAENQGNGAQRSDDF